MDTLHRPPSGRGSTAFDRQPPQNTGQSRGSGPTSQPSEAFAETWRKSQRAQVREALRALPPEQLKVLELTYFSGYTHTEIAKLLDLPLGTVKGRMRLGLKKIREYFDSRGMAVPG